MAHNTKDPAKKLLGGLGLDRRRMLAMTGIAAMSGFADPFPALASKPSKGRSFGFADSSVPEGFLRDGKPFQVRSGEMHPSRIPAEYWRHRIRMAKAMGLNTIAFYLMWNHHESEPGVWDFSTGNHNIEGFIRLCAEEDMLVFLRPGPYACAEWDNGGLPAYLLRDPASHPRFRSDTAFMEASRRWIAKVAALAAPHMYERGGPVIMVQIENEYASFGNDMGYLPAVRQMWLDAGITGPFGISDGLQQVINAGTYLPGAALGLDGDTDFALAQTVSQGAPVWVGEGYPGWITHWGDKAYAPGDYRETLKTLMRDRISFNLYVVHGGTNFGFTAGANSNHDGSNFEPTITSYDYGAPITESGLPTAQYHDLRQTIVEGAWLKPMAIPAPIPAVSFSAVTTRPVGSLWARTASGKSVNSPAPMELLLHQDQGMVLYTHQLAPGGGGQLTIDGLRDEAIVLLDGKRIGWLSRVPAAKAPNAINLQPRAQAARLDVLVFPYGRVNYGHYTTDRKGIIGAVELAGTALTGWEVVGLPLTSGHLAAMRSAPDDGKLPLLHEAEFTVSGMGDTFLDMKGWGVGFVWVNGNLLGRHSRLGPQTCLYCPATFLKQGTNVITVLDIHAEPGGKIAGLALPNDR